MLFSYRNMTCAVLGVKCRQYSNESPPSCLTWTASSYMSTGGIQRDVGRTGVYGRFIRSIGHHAGSPGGLLNWACSTGREALSQSLSLRSVCRSPGTPISQSRKFTAPSQLIVEHRINVSRAKLGVVKHFTVEPDIKCSACRPSRRL